MNNIKILIPFILLCSACNNEPPKQEQAIQDTATHAERQPDTSDRFLFENIDTPMAEGTYIVDDYPITEEMLRENKYNLSSGDLTNFEQLWFINDSLQQLIIITIGTDYYRMGVSHFYIHDALQLMDQLNLNFQNKAHNAATKKEIAKDWDGFVKQAKNTASAYFTSNKDIKLGDSLQKIIRIYGLADSTSTKNGITRCQWTYNGDTPVDWDSTLPAERPIAKNSFGHGIVMLFKDDKLVAQVLFNDIP